MKEFNEGFEKIELKNKSFKDVLETYQIVPDEDWCLLKFQNEDLYGFNSLNEWKEPSTILMDHIYNILLEISYIKKNIEISQMIDNYKIYLILHNKDIQFPIDKITDQSSIKTLDTSEMNRYFYKKNPSYIENKLNQNNIYVSVFKHPNSIIENFLEFNDIDKKGNKIEELVEILNKTSEENQQQIKLNLKLEILHYCLTKSGIANAREKIAALTFTNFPSEVVTKKHMFEFKNKENQKLLGDMLNFLEKPEYDCFSSEYIDVLSSMRDYILLENLK